jgi:hypothetical protein
MKSQADESGWINLHIFRLNININKFKIKKLCVINYSI